MSAAAGRSLRLCSRHLSSWRAGRGALTLLPPAPATLTPRVTRFVSCSLIKLAATPADLDKAKERVTTLSEDPGNDVKLKLYGLYKQVRYLQRSSADLEEVVRLMEIFVLCVGDNRDLQHRQAWDDGFRRKGKVECLEFARNTFSGE